MERPFLVRVRPFIQQTMSMHRSSPSVSYELFILSWLVGVLLLFGITLFCVMLTLLHVCLCFLHANFLPASMLCGKTQSYVQITKRFCCKECDLQHNGINDKAYYETIFLSSHNIYHHIAQPYLLLLNFMDKSKRENKKTSVN